MAKKIIKKEKKNELKIIKDKDGNILKKTAFIIEEMHPAIGRILEVDGRKYKFLDDFSNPSTGTFMARLTPEDEERMEEYDREVDELSEKLIEKIDIKRMIKEQIKTKAHQEIKTGLYILKKEKDGKGKVTTEHTKHCYGFKMYLGNQEFEFMSGSNIIDDPNININN